MHYTTYQRIIIKISGLLTAEAPSTGHPGEDQDDDEQDDNANGHYYTDDRT